PLPQIELEADSPPGRTRSVLMLRRARRWPVFAAGAGVIAALGLVVAIAVMPRPVALDVSLPPWPLAAPLPPAATPTDTAAPTNAAAAPESVPAATPADSAATAAPTLPAGVAPAAPAHRSRSRSRAAAPAKWDPDSPFLPPEPAQ